MRNESPTPFLFLGSGLLLLLAVSARADTLHVPGDFATIQAAVDASDQNDVILISSGTYDEQVVLSGIHDIELRAQGKVELTGTDVQIGVDIADCEDIVLTRLRFRGLSVGVRASGCDDLVLRQCRAEDVAANAFSISESVKVTLDHCVVDGAGAEAYLLDDVLGGRVRRCSARDALTGVLISDSSGIEVDHARVDDTSGNGIELDGGCSGVEVHHSRIVAAAGEGLFVAGDFNRLHHDLVVEPVGIGILLGPGGLGNVLDHERVVASGDVSFWVRNQSQELRDCRAVKPLGTGVQCSDSGKHLLLRVRVLQPENFGVLVDAGCESCTLLDNRVAHAGDSGIRTQGDKTLISGNVATASGDDGFLIGSSLNIVTGNKAKGSQEFDLHDTVGGDSTYLDNAFGTVSLP